MPGSRTLRWLAPFARLARLLGHRSAPAVLAVWAASLAWAGSQFPQAPAPRPALDGLGRAAWLALAHWGAANWLANLPAALWLVAAAGVAASFWLRHAGGRDRAMAAGLALAALAGAAASQQGRSPAWVDVAIGSTDLPATAWLADAGRLAPWRAAFAGRCAMSPDRSLQCSVRGPGFGAPFAIGPATAARSGSWTIGWIGDVASPLDAKALPAHWRASAVDSAAVGPVGVSRRGGQLVAATDHRWFAGRPPTEPVARAAVARLALSETPLFGAPAWWLIAATVLGAMAVAFAARQDRALGAMGIAGLAGAAAAVALAAGMAWQVPQHAMQLAWEPRFAALLAAAWAAAAMAAPVPWRAVRSFAAVLSVAAWASYAVGNAGGAAVAGLFD